jgi:DUF1009 family protein
MVSVVEKTKSKSLAGNKALGIVAGEGKLPAVLANAAREQGYKVTAFALSPEAAEGVEKVVDKVIVIAPGQLTRNVTLFKAEGLTKVVFVGKVPKLNLLRNIFKMDWLAVKELSKLPNFTDDTIQRAVGDFTESHGVKVLTQSEFLRHLFPDVGVLTKRPPTAEEYADIQYGLKIATEIARLDIGQTVIVKDRMIIAIEAAEGTDEAIKRAVSYTRGPVVVVKVAKPNQDERFDIPTVGMNTLQSMQSAKPGGVLALAAKETFVVDREEMVKFCDENDMTLVAVSKN